MPGPYTIRVKVPAGVKLMPHRHPEDRVYIVISGVFYIGLGDQFDGEKVNACPPGSVHRSARQHVPRRRIAAFTASHSVHDPGRLSLS